MKNIELEKLGLAELNESELNEANGGGIIVYAFLAGLALAYYEKHKDM